jgi:hypothetical protein
VFDYNAIFEALVADPRYQKNLDWGEPRKGHPEATIRAHVAELERNLERLKDRVSEAEYSKLRILIHVHDAFKPEAKRGVPITDPASHASLARRFLEEYCDDRVLLDIVQYHDEPYALWKQQRTRGECNQERMAKLLEIGDWDLFLLFNVVDGCTAGKSREPLEWFFEETKARRESRITAADIL